MSNNFNANSFSTQRGEKTKKKNHKKQQDVARTIKQNMKEHCSDSG